MYNGKNIAAVVITHNRLSLLKLVIEGIRNQTILPDKLIVVNNASTDGTEEWLNKQLDITLITQGNTGSSGGQYTGIKTAYDMGYEWIWTMDDDVIPSPNCLELMLNKGTEPLRAPLRVTRMGNPCFYDIKKLNLGNPFRSIWEEIISIDDLKGDKTNVSCLTFEGPLINRSIIEKIGLPDRNFFIYADDTEYFIRAFKAELGMEIITNARLTRLIEADDQRTSFTWKHYYIIRNIIAIDILHCQPIVRILRPFGYLIRWLFRCRKISDFQTVFKAFKDGYLYKRSEINAGAESKI